LENLQEAADNVFPGLMILLFEEHNQEENSLVNIQNFEKMDVSSNNIPIIIGCVFAGLILLTISVVMLCVIHYRR